VLDSTNAAIVVGELRKSYGKVEAVKGISFVVRAGTTTALLGGNGAGKTTTLSMLLGVLTPTAGSISVLNCDMLRDRYQVLPRMNFTSPYVDLPRRLTVGENLRVFADLYGVRDPRVRIADLARQFDLAELLNRPEVLLLDEPTASLDPDIGDRMRTYLEHYQRESRCTMLLASHNMGEVERMCDDVIMLREGQVVDQGSPQELIAKYGRENMEEVFLDIARGGGEESELGGPTPEVAA
jgi:ABC-2 type transport system ATP-binding protein